MRTKTNHRLDRLPLREASFAPPPPAEKNCPASCFLVSCGIQQAADAVHYSFDNRTRSSFCLLQYTLAGEGAFADLTTGRETRLPRGTAFLITAPGPTRYWLPAGGQWKLAYALFSGIAAFHHCRQVIAAAGCVLDLSAAAGVLDAIAGINEASAPEAHPDFFQSSGLVYQLLMQLRHYAGMADPSQPDAAQLAPALAMIDAEYADSGLGVDQLAAACGYSRYHFSRLFQRHTGLSPQAFLIKTRLKQALRLLTRSQLPPKQIATACGINDYSYFCLLFRRHYGLTPGSLRHTTKS